MESLLPPARRWTLDIELTPAQQAALKAAATATALVGSPGMAEACRSKRRHWQEEGRQRARTGDALHQAGCLLYWAEGAKSRNLAKLANSDMHLVRLFHRFLDECFDIQAEDLTVRFHLYTGNGLTVREVEDRWLTVLGLPRSCLRKHAINRPPAPTSGVKRNKLPYGVCDLVVRRSTWLVQHIYGAIQEYGAFDEPRWLNCDRGY